MLYDKYIITSLFNKVNKCHVCYSILKTEKFYNFIIYYSKYLNNYETTSVT